MKTAIITGSSGLLGKSLANHLAAKGMSVLCLGKRNLDREQLKSAFRNEATYLELPMAEIERLGDCISQNNWEPGENCVFYHFAWRGIGSLTDGTFSDQLNNAIWSAGAVKAAKTIGCKKFVNAGTLEETFISRFLADDMPLGLKTTQSNYGLAKIASRDMCKMVAYLEKIDYVHTRLSAPLDSALNCGGYIAATLKKIQSGLPYDPPTNPKPFDFISVIDACIAFELIGKFGKNKADYFVGSGEPSALRDFFADFQHRKEPASRKNNPKITLEYSHIFNNEKLIADTGFCPKPFLETVEKKP